MSSHPPFNASISNSEVQHTHYLSEHIGALYLNQEYSDVTLIVEGHHFPSHKVILAARSEYFRALLYGGMMESHFSKVELKDTSVTAFKYILRYIYTGLITLNNLADELILEILRLSDKYGFQNLVSSVSEFLKSNLCKKNVCYIYDTALLCQLPELIESCSFFLDQHAPDIINHESFEMLNISAIRSIISRDSFCATEVEIFQAVYRWVKNNPKENYSEVLSAVRLSLMSISDLLNIVRPTGLISPDAILDAIQSKTESRDMDLHYRGYLIPEENMATPKHNATVLIGEVKHALLDGDNKNYDMERGFSRHLIDDTQDNGIIVKLGTQCIVNHLKILLWDKDQRCYSYYIEISMDQKDWYRVIDYSKYYCRSWQYLYFPPKVVRYIRIVGTHNTVNKVFHIVSLEAYFTRKTFEVDQDGIVIPKCNVATIPMSACVIEGVCRSRNALLNGDNNNYNWDSGYTCHQLGSGAIVVQLGQPYVISSMRLLLWDCDDRSYSYYVEVSVNLKEWQIVCDRTLEPCKAWQNITFTRRPVVYIRIIGTHNTANEVFHCVHFECPAEEEHEKQISPSHSLTQTLDHGSSSVNVLENNESNGHSNFIN